MSARKMRNTWWIDFRFNGRRYRKRSPENTRAGAQAFETVLRQKVARGESIEPERSETILEENKRFADYIGEWLKVYAKPNNKPSTLRAKENIIRTHLLPFFGEMALREVTNIQVERFKALKNSEGAAPKTVNNFLSVLRTCLSSANEWGYINSLPRFTWLKVPPQKFDFLSEDEANHFLRQSHGSSWYLMILCALRTGMRLGELCGLDWEDVDLVKGLITVRRSLVEGVMGSPKNNRIRHIPISKDLLTEFQQHRLNTGLVFKRSNGEMMNVIYAWRGLQEACLQANIRSFGWHTLRHTFASHLVMKGVPIRAVQALMGHSTIQMTERYSHLAPSSLHDAIATLEQSKTIEIQNFGQPVGNTLSYRLAIPA